jgi:hypothetical protein
MFDMKIRQKALVLLGAVLCGASSTVFAEKCYNVSGSVDTINQPDGTQIGTIFLMYYGKNPGDVQFENTGTIFGTITGFPIVDYSNGTVTVPLSHKVAFASGPKGSGFSTEGDKATIKIIDMYDPSGTPNCSYPVSESITKIVNGTGNFKNVSSANITAEGTVSNCADYGGENHNSFDLSGTICMR